MKISSTLKEKNINKHDILVYARGCFELQGDVDTTHDNFFNMIFKNLRLPESESVEALYLFLEQFLPLQREAAMSEYISKLQALSILDDMCEFLQGNPVSGITLQPSESDKDKLMFKIEGDDIYHDTPKYLDELWEQIKRNLKLKRKLKGSNLQGIQVGCVCVTWQFSRIQGMKEHILERIPHCEVFFNEVNIIKIVFNDEILYAIIIVHYNTSEPNRFQVDFAFTVRQLKENLHEKCVVPLDPDRQCVYFQGEMLQDDMQQLEQCGIQAGSDIYLYDRGEHEHGPAVEADSPSISIVQNGKFSSEINIDAVSEKGSEHHQQLNDGSSQQSSEFNRAEVKQNDADQVEYQEYPEDSSVAHFDGSPPPKSNCMVKDVIMPASPSPSVLKHDMPSIISNLALLEYDQKTEVLLILFRSIHEHRNEQVEKGQTYNNNDLKQCYQQASNLNEHFIFNENILSVKYLDYDESNIDIRSALEELYNRNRNINRHSSKKVFNSLLLYLTQELNELNYSELNRKFQFNDLELTLSTSKKDLDNLLTSLCLSNV